MLTKVIDSYPRHSRLHALSVLVAETPTDAVVRTISSLVASGTFSVGEMAAQCGSHRVGHLSYATACALYEATRRSGHDAALVDDYRLEVCRCTWGVPRGASL
jgi:hypothetical protein